MERIFDSLPDALLEQTLHIDETGERLMVETRQDVEEIVEHCKANHNEVTSLDRHGDLTHVAQIPLSIYYDLQQKGILRDQKALKDWLNDPDNRVFRTRPGKV